MMGFCPGAIFDEFVRGEENLPGTTELPDEERIHVVLEERQPVCYGFGLRGPLKERCPLNNVNASIRIA